MHDLYDLKIPIIVTENGTYSIGEEQVDAQSGMIEDCDRIRYIGGFLEWLEKAIDEGFDIRGYYLWSLMDNFEWSAGRSFKFGNEEADVYSINLSSGKQFELEKEPQASSHFMKKKSNVKER